MLAGGEGVAEKVQAVCARRSGANVPPSASPTVLASQPIAQPRTASPSPPHGERKT
ncbi:hypothetical protein WOLCODRAFT_148784 [Wolfiporia cocos MD-104 SS10]|uniref:Uncharacterized protein n=1 Tax=Wolfiporia cocos (strain MD-104) TaxID=742152 RepID=A0A2H3JMF8_WOLCO|nr:hypothetical protein WOLCODRAFT_148784 [Wolfiporia cocos MD-104 SS10]